MAEVAADHSTNHNRVFISYSRANGSFAEQLRSALMTEGFEAYLDKHDIAPGEAWQERLSALILSADAVVYCLSPNFVASRICDWEVNEAERLAKRILPVVAVDTPSDLVPQRLKRLNYILMRNEPEKTTGLSQLVSALNTDIVWHRECRRLVELAANWLNQGRPSDSLLSAADMRASEQLFQTRPRNAEAPPTFLSDHLNHSRQVRDAEERHVRRVTGRAFVMPANRAIDEGEMDQAIRLAAAGALLAKDLSFTDVPELWPPVERALLSPRTTFTYSEHDLEKYLNCAHYSSNGRLAVSASDDETVRVWKTETGDEIDVLHTPGSGASYALFSPTSRDVCSVHYDGVIRLWREGGVGFDLVKELKGHARNIMGMDISRDGKLLVTTSEDRTARIWHLPDLSLAATLDAHGDSVYGARFAFDGFGLITAGADDTAIIWSIGPTVERLRSLEHGGTVINGAFSRDGKRVVTACSDAIARMWDTETGDLVREFHGHGDWVTDAVFDGGGTRVLTSSSDRTARLWSIESGAEIARLNGHRGGVLSCSFHPLDDRILTASMDGSARFWRLPNKSSIELNPGLALVASLANGIGNLTEQDRNHLLLRDAPQNLYTEALRQFGCQANDPQVLQAIEYLRGTVHALAAATVYK